MLQQNWVLIDRLVDGTNKVYFISDTSEVFDEMTFLTGEIAESALKKNGFSVYSECGNAQKVIVPPEPPYRKGRHPNGAIYSSGRYWVE